MLRASYDIAERKIINERISYLEGIALRFGEIDREIRVFAAKEVKRSADDFYISSIFYNPDNRDQPLTFYLGSVNDEYSDYTLVVECGTDGKPLCAGYVGVRKLFEKEAKDEKDISDFGGTVRACPRVRGI